MSDTGRIEAELEATRELAALTAQRVTITVGYFHKRGGSPFKLEDGEIVIANERLHGYVYDTTMAALGRGNDTASAKVTELIVGSIPFSSQAGGSEKNIAWRMAS